MPANIRVAVRDDIESIAAVHVSSWRESYPGIVDAHTIDERDLETRIAQWRQSVDQPGRMTLVAEDGTGAIVGFASALTLCAPVDGFDSYLQLLYLLSSAKGQGTGRALLRMLVTKLLAAGCGNMALRVLRRNPARAFYERLGAQLCPGGISIDAGRFDDVVYEFPDLCVLL